MMIDCEFKILQGDVVHTEVTHQKVRNATEF